MPSSGSAASSTSADLALLVEEREQDHGQAVPVACGRELGVLRELRPDRFHIAGLDRGDQRVGHSRRIPQMRSATSFVKAASWKKLAGLPRDVSENATVPASMRTR